MKNISRFAIALSLSAMGFAPVFADNGTVYQMELNAKKVGAEIQPDMYGIFFEDINFGADGGLYAELIKNRSFEFPQSFTGWTPFGDVQVLDQLPCFSKNPRYVRINSNGSLSRAGLDNEGFKGIGLKAGEEYHFSAYARVQGNEPLKLIVELVSSDNNNVLTKELEVNGKEWHKISATLKSPLTDAHARMRVVLVSRGTIDLDHISLFPAKTWKGRENGMRIDLTQALNDLNPGVFRFPGGCIVEGTTLDTRYQWKNTVGPVENRPLNINRWNYTFSHKFFPDYFQSYGLGFYEYFLLSEDFGAEPLPVLSCGLACQYEGDNRVPLNELQPYIQDAIDLIEFANGPVTSTWGKVRAEMGHPAPFNLKMVAIGNEQWGAVYPERLERFVQELRKQHPEIKIIGSSGPYSDGTDFDYLWPEMKRLKVDLVDEHFYKSPEWFFANAARYDHYDRKGPKVFAGEYASHDQASGKANNFLSALSEAAFMTGLERNADVVHLATYAPLFAHVDAWQWCPDLIWFDNLSLVRTPNYYVQQMYGMNAGTHVLPLLMDGKAVTGQDKLYASATIDARTSELIIKIVNSDTTDKSICINISGLKKGVSDGSSWYLQTDDLGVKNTIENPHALIPAFRPARAVGNAVRLTAQKQSFSVYKFPLAQ